MSRWSRQATGTRTAYISALRRNGQEEATQDNEKRAQILAERFFPGDRLADLTDIKNDQQPISTIHISITITLDEIEEVIHKFPNRKAPGPDSILNEILKIITSIIKEDLAQAVSKLL